MRKLNMLKKKDNLIQMFKANKTNPLLMLIPMLMLMLIIQYLRCLQISLNKAISKDKGEIKICY